MYKFITGGVVALVAASVIQACSTHRWRNDLYPFQAGLKDPNEAYRELAYNQPRPGDYMKLNLSAGEQIFYEVQVRTANACNPEAGNDDDPRIRAQKSACAKKISPPNLYRAVDGDGKPLKCGEWDYLSKIKLGTLDDMLKDTNDYHDGITLKYIKEKVGATTVWLMPIFSNNDKERIPDKCDNLGSPYAVRDYMHVSGRLDNDCISAGLDEESGDKTGGKSCWGNEILDEFISKAHKLGLKVILDVAFNHFGHDYHYYDYMDFVSIDDRIQRSENLDGLWDFNKTFDSQLVRPALLDTVEQLNQTSKRNPRAAEILKDIKSKCPEIGGEKLVRLYNMWREMLDWEKKSLKCEDPVNLEHVAPGFYLGEKRWGDPTPSTRYKDNFTNNWVDVKFLYHHEYHGNSNDGRDDVYAAFVRNREYLFRIMNYWVSRGIDGFRMDHTTDFDSGMGPNEWKYILSKVNHYDWIRKGKPTNHTPPIYLAEEFGDQKGMNHVVDIMTDGYVGDINGRGGQTKNTSFVEVQLQKATRFSVEPDFPTGRLFVLRALETHDEARLFQDTGFNQWTGAGFWGIGAASRGTPMILMGQEFGETEQLAFRKSYYLHSRFYSEPSHQSAGTELVDFYHKMAVARTNPKNRALLSPNAAFLRSRWTTEADQRIFAQVKWDHTKGPNVVFTFHNLWETKGDVEQSFFIPPELGKELLIQDNVLYRLVEVFSDHPMGPCHTGAVLKSDLYVNLHPTERLQWLRLEVCQP